MENKQKQEIENKEAALSEAEETLKGLLVSTHIKAGEETVALPYIASCSDKVE